MNYSFYKELGKLLYLSAEQFVHAEVYESTERLLKNEIKNNRQLNLLVDGFKELWNIYENTELTEEDINNTLKRFGLQYLLSNDKIENIKKLLGEYGYDSVSFEFVDNNEGFVFESSWDYTIKAVLTDEGVSIYQYKQDPYSWTTYEECKDWMGLETKFSKEEVMIGSFDITKL